MPNLLFLDGKSGAGGTACAVFQYVNATPTQLGNAFGTNFGTEQLSAPRNGVIQFQGELYSFAKDGIYKKDDPTLTTGGWTQQIAFTLVVATTGYSGLYPIEVGGVLNLVGVFRSNDTSNSFRWVKFDGTTWTQAGSFTSLLQTSHLIDAIVYRGVLHCVWYQSNPNTTTFDPAANSFATVTLPFSSVGGHQSMCVFLDRLFMVSKANGAQWALYEFAGGTWGHVTNVGVTTNASGITEGKACLFTDGVNMYAAYHTHQFSTADTGWRLEQFDSVLAQTNATADLPAALRSANDGGSFAGGTAVLITHRMFAIYDVDTTLGTLGLYLAHTAESNPGTSYTLFVHNGPGSVMTSVDVGGDVRHGPPSGHPQGGCRIFTPGELDVKIVARTAVLGGEQISFTAYGGGTGRKFKLFYALDGEPNLLEATLATPVTGGSATFNAGLNQVEDIAADGVTVYTIIWDITADSVVAGTILDRFPQITV